MGALPFLLLIIVAVIYYSAIPLGYIVAIYFIGKEIGTKFGTKFNLIFISIMIFGPILWLLMGYISFESSCKQSEGIKIYRTVSGVKGFTALSPSPVNRKVYRSSTPDKLLRNGTYQCLVTETYNHRFWKESKLLASVNDKGTISQHFLTEKQRKELYKKSSEYTFNVTQPKIFSFLTSPFFKTSDIIIKKKSSGEILAEAREYLFGGRFLSIYINALHGGKSNDYAACGFLHKEPYDWRPQNFEEYYNKESELITSTLIPIQD